MRASNKIWTIISHEYLSKVKSKGFIIGTFVAPLAIVVIFVVSIMAALLNKGETTIKLAILDNSGLVGTELVLADTSKFYNTKESQEELSEKLQSEEIDGFAVLDKEIIQNGNVEIFTRGGGGIGYTENLQKKLSKILRYKRLNFYNAPDSLVRALSIGVNVENKKVTDTGEIKKDTTGSLAFVGYGLGFTIYMLMFVYGGMVLRSVIEEKSNRIVEIIASSARPFDILFGKVIAVGSAGLTQILVWMILVGGIFIFAAPIIGLLINQFGGIDPAALQGGMSADAATQEKVQEIMTNFPEISLGLVIGFVFFFLAGYFIYASLFAGLGSAVDNDQDAAQLQTPFTIPLILPIILVQPVMSNPDALWVKIVSLFPLFSPILMIVRIASTNVPAWEIALSVVLLIGAFLGILWMAAKVYRVGILMTGKKPTFKEIWKWVMLK
jgi:ABC-2 type transport system permease protein